MTPKSLLASIALPVSVVDKRGSMPILGSLHIADGRITGTDLERQISAAVDLDLRCCVPADRLTAALKALPPDCDLRLDMQEHRLRVRGGRSKFMIQTLPVEDFPSQEWVEPDVVVENPSDVAAAIRTVEPAMATHDVRAYLCGIATQAGAINGTNGYWAAKHECAALPDGIIIPRTSVPMLLAAMEEETVRYGVNERGLHIAANGYRLSTKLVEGKFPDMTRYWKQEHARGFAWTVNREEFVAATSSVYGMRQDKGGIGEVVIADGSMSFFLNRYGEEAEASLACDGPDLRCAFDFGYFMLAAKGLEGESLTLSNGGDNMRPMLFTGENPAQRVIVMPGRA